MARNSWALSLALTVIVSLAAVQGGSAGAQMPGTFDATLIVGRLLRSAFPDWGTTPLVTEIAYGRSGPGVVEFNAWDTPDRPTAPGRDFLAQIRIAGRLEFDKHGLSVVHFMGRAVHGNEMDLLTRYSRSYSIKEAIGVLAAQQPKYPPADEARFSTWLRSLDLSPLLGKYELGTPEFVVRSPGESADVMCWVVRATARTGEVYRLRFEPYGGRLYSLLRTEPL